LNAIGCITGEKKKGRRRLQLKKVDQFFKNQNMFKRIFRINVYILLMKIQPHHHLKEFPDIMLQSVIPEIEKH